MPRRPITPALSTEFSDYALAKAIADGKQTMAYVNELYYQKVKEEGYSRAAWDKFCLANFECPDYNDEYGY